MPYVDYILAVLLHILQSNSILGARAGNWKLGTWSSMVFAIVLGSWRCE